jgi:copper(I)-binding protein
MSRLLAALAVAAFATTAHAADILTVRQPWSRPAQAGMNGGGFFTLANAGKTPVILKSVQSAAAAKVEMHQSSMTGGVMSMRRQDDGVVVPAGGQIAFAPGGYQSQNPGEKVSVTLVFDNGRKMQVDLPVQLAPPGVGTAPEHRH